MRTRTYGAALLTSALTLLTLGALPPAATADTATTAGAAAPAPVLRAGAWKPRPATYPATVTRTDLAIPMSDGTVLRGDITLPATAAGTAAPGRFPVIVTITAYNKSVLSSAGDLGGPGPDYLVRRGYAQLTVDARGTGSSEGTWGAFSARENKDGAEVVEWAASKARPWSNGSVGMRGPSYMGINQIFTAAQRPRGLKAIFPQVPAGDVYRDVVATGGQVDVGFIPLWMGLVTGTGVIPPAVTATDPQSGLAALLDHLQGALTFTAPLLLDAALGGDAAYDGPFYRTRSPLRVIDQVRVPTFLVAGQEDLFQRGTPMLFERLQANGVPTRLIVGPWDHLQASGGQQVVQAGHGSLAELQLRWFDRWLRADRSTDLGAVPPLTYFENGSGRWRTQQRWISPRAKARTYRLSGPATAGGGHGRLTLSAAEPGTALVPPVPASGLCTRSSNQWTAGLPQQVLADNPCFTDQAANDQLGLVYETAPTTTAVRFAGPMNARLFVSAPSGDGLLSVSVSDVAPDGTVRRLSGGWQMVSQRALDRSRTRFLDGAVLQPFHPFTRASKDPLTSGEIAPVDVEIFPTGAVIKPGHRLRLAVQAFDVPHLIPTLPDALSTLVPLTVHTSERYPSGVTLPWLR